MSRVTRFAGRDSGPAARVSGFLGHLRENGMRLGVTETGLALAALTHVDAARPQDARRAIQAVCTGSKDEAERFPVLFDSFWMDAGRVRQKISAAPPQGKFPSPYVHSSRDIAGDDPSGVGSATAPEGGSGEAEHDGEGKLVATDVANFMRKDLREIVRREDVSEAEAVAYRLGKALRDHRSRRRIAARRGAQLHFRKTIRRSIASGGEPLQLVRKMQPDRSRKIVALCDVSGSMTVYSRVFLSFVAGLMRAANTTDAYLFHTRLVRITEALRDRDAMKAIGRMSLMADGFGGGSKIGECLAHFSQSYAKRLVNGRSAVLIMSDGYDTSAPDRIGSALTRLRKRGCWIIWLNPLKSWRDYEPITSGMTAALPHLDLFSAASTLSDLAALEQELRAL